MKRDELIKLGKKILNCEGTEDEIDEMIEIFNKNVSDEVKKAGLKESDFVIIKY